MTKQYRKYHNQLDDVLKALMKTYTSWETLEVIQENMKEVVSSEQLELLLTHLQTRMFCSRTSNYISFNNYGPSTYQILLQGILFLEEGGFKSHIRRSIQSDRWTIAKTAITAISTVAIISITYFQWKATDEANIDREKVKLQDLKIDSLSEKVEKAWIERDSVIKILQKDTLQ